MQFVSKMAKLQFLFILLAWQVFILDPSAVRERERERDLTGTWFFAVISFLCPIRWGPAGYVTYVHTPHESHINIPAHWNSSEHNSWKKDIWSLNEWNMLDGTCTCLNLTFLNLTCELTALSCTRTSQLSEKKNNWGLMDCSATITSQTALTKAVLALQCVSDQSCSPDRLLLDLAWSLELLLHFGWPSAFSSSQRRKTLLKYERNQNDHKSNHKPWFKISYIVTEHFCQLSIWICFIVFLTVSSRHQIETFLSWEKSCHILLP